MKSLISVLSEFPVPSFVVSVDFKLLPQSSVLLPPSDDGWATVVCFQHWCWKPLNNFSWGEFRCFQSICWTVGKPLMPPPSSPVKPQTCFSFAEDCFSTFVPSVKSKATFIRRTKSCVLSAELSIILKSFFHQRHKGEKHELRDISVCKHGLGRAAKSTSL